MKRALGALVAVSAIALLLFFLRSTEQPPGGRSSKSPRADDTRIPDAAFGAKIRTPTGAPPDTEEDEDDDVSTGETPDLITELSLATPTPVPSPAPPSPTPAPAATAEQPVDPRLEALREIASEEKKGRRSRGGPPMSAPAQENANPDPHPTPTATSGALPRVSGEPRGYQMLYLMQPRARETVEKQVENLLASQVADLYLGALVDGTFTQNFEYLNTIIRRLNTDGRTLTLVLYFSSGPTMRRNSTPPVRTAFSLIPPADFRYLVEYDQEIRRALTELARKSRPSFELNLSLNKGNQNFAIPMLEDNLDRQAYRVMRSILGGELDGKAVFIRNPCGPRCFEGNDTESLGDSIEMHESSDFDSLGAGDGYALDGENVAYPGEDPAGKLSLDALRNMLDRSVIQRHRYFGLWRAQRQGLGDRNTHPDDRTYEVPTAEQSSLEIDLLRQGLTPVIEVEPTAAPDDGQFIRFD